MDYKEALTIGRVAEGTIKCTFATLYDKNGERLFSIQRVPALKFQDKLYDENGYFKGYDKERFEYFAKVAETARGDFDYSIQLGIVYASGQPQDGKLVPVKLTDEAYVYLRNAIMTSKKYPVTEVVERKLKSGLIVKEKVTTYEVKAKYKHILDLMDQDSLTAEPMFYIKPIAFDWHASVVSDSNYENADKKFSYAKKILFIALAANLIQ